MTKPSITTGVGDQGTTRLFSGQEVSKDDPRTHAYGDVDELVSLLGVARIEARHPEVQTRLRAIQKDLFVVASELATTPDRAAGLPSRVGDPELEAMDAQRRWIEDQVRMPGGFVLPGGTLAGARIDHARAVSRRCERRVVGLAHDGLINNPALLVWFNRLSDVLWLLARLEEGDAMELKDGP